MTLQFSKYHGTGNDFILINNFDGLIDLSLEKIQGICSRHTGVGSDGLILIEQSEIADFNMNFYNPDGSQSYCGNGSRCAHAFARKLGIAADSCSFEAFDGVHSSDFDGAEYEISLGEVHEIEQVGNDLLLNTGSPHYIAIQGNLEGLAINEAARKIRYNERFSDEGVNVNFIDWQNGLLHMRTYERGVEGETLSCGTGVTASGIAAHHLGYTQSPVFVSTRGGRLSVSFAFGPDGYTNIKLKGPVEHVFNGQLYL
jgi:diaminopimelate epimerase